MLVSTTLQEVTKVTAGECLGKIQIYIHTTEGTVAILSSKQALLKIADGIPEAIAEYEQELKKANEWGRNNALRMNVCEMIKCPDYKNGLCTNQLDYVNKNTGEDTCPRNLAAIPRAEYEEY